MGDHRGNYKEVDGILKTLGKSERFEEFRGNSGKLENDSGTPAKLGELQVIRRALGQLQELWGCGVWNTGILGIISEMSGKVEGTSGTLR